MDSRCMVMEASLSYGLMDRISKKHIVDPQINSCCPECRNKEIILKPNPNTHGYYIWRCNICGYHWYKWSFILDNSGFENLSIFHIFYSSPLTIPKYQLTAVVTMNRFLRMAIIMVITFAVIISIFWFILPLTDIPEQIGSAYFIVALLGSLVISYFVSWGLGRILKWNIHVDTTPGFPMIG